jgi:hypothetical protein
MLKGTGSDITFSVVATDPLELVVSLLIEVIQM